ncbi:PAS domain S-box-containing protein [Dendrosporobacter quercicolus]|uniref:PAS domain S-box-containing protein n=1 Tax=Dendrosporobacter quercicolus TaxID=146817 RepID=A0A1G9SYF7_9FIRM|nr:PAS domain S-box protein [Dendrosporobacter quercicolus]SDM40454.1 PAS domain S-box-containing protein [Dendrosporobacter quercicolus]
MDRIAVLLSELLQKRGAPSQLDSQEYQSIRKMIEEFIAIREFTHVISNGDLSRNLEIKGYWAGALKALQANLRHLTWQAATVASGDYNQRVVFMGDFSVAFNTMIKRLEQAEENERKYVQALRESEQKYRLIAENTDDVILLMDARMQVSYVSPSVEKLLGYTPDEFCRLPLPERVLPAMEAALRKLQAQSEPADITTELIELEQRCKNGKLIWMESLISIAKTAGGEFSGFLCVTRNITERKLTENLLQRSYLRRQRNEFFNQLLQQAAVPEAQTYTRALQLGIQLPRQLSVYFMRLEFAGSGTDDIESLQYRQRIIDTILDILNTKDCTTIAWEAAGGIGIVQPANLSASRKAGEMAEAGRHIQRVLTAFPRLQVRVGIADHFEALASFAQRFQHARAAVMAGRAIAPDKPVYHFEDCGVYQVLANLYDTTEARLFIERTLGPLIAYDQANGAELVFTLDRILSGHSLKEVSEEIFLHYKTIVFRKQRIEHILQVSLDSAETRLALGTALHLLKIAAN